MQTTTTPPEVQQSPTLQTTTNTSQFKRIQSFSDDLLFLIFVYLSAPDLRQVEGVNVIWRNIVKQKDDHLFEPLVNLLWQRLAFNQAKEMNVLTKIQALSLSSLKKSLVGIDLSRCIEKKDYQRTLLAKLVFSKVMDQELKGNDIRFKGKYLSMYYPDWSLEIRPFKASYYYTKNEIKRKSINMQELCKIDWIFKFKNRSYMVEDENGEENGEAGWRCKFHLDYSMSSTLHNEEYEWRFVEGGDGTVKIQVASYPALSSYRMKDGSWGLENMHVYFRQLQSIDVDDIPITANI